MNRYLKTAIAGVIVFAIISAIRGVFSAESATAALSALCDGGFITGILFVCSGLLVFSGKMGIFDGLSYAVQIFVLKHWRRDPKAKEDFYTFREAKNAKRRDRRFFDIVAVGLGFIALSVVFLLLM